MGISICKCGKKILWSRIREGNKKIPLDCSAPVYELNADDSGETCSRIKYAYVSHFATCKYANDFSNKSKGNLPAQNQDLEEEAMHRKITECQY